VRGDLAGVAALAVWVFLAMFAAEVVCLAVLGAVPARSSRAVDRVAFAVDGTTDAVHEQSHDLYGALHDIRETLLAIRGELAARDGDRVWCR
jgi:hypothetical protein